MSREFAVSPIRPRVFLLPGIALAAALTAMCVVMVHGDFEVAAMFPVLLLAAGLIAFTLRRRRVGLENGVLTVAAGFNSRRIAIGDIDLDAARIVDLREHTGLKPMLRVMGTSLPGYHAGHFRLRDRSKAFALLSDPSYVLVLPETSGRKLLLSLVQPQALLDELRRVAERRGAR
jgi:Bacterial PH domain